jgi:hypothetical protein
MEPECSLPCSQNPEIPMPFVTIDNRLFSYFEELLAPCPIPKL